MGRQWLVLPLINNHNDQAYLNLSVADVAVEVDAEMNACPQTGFCLVQQGNWTCLSETVHWSWPSPIKDF